MTRSSPHTGVDGGRPRAQPTVLVTSDRPGLARSVPLQLLAARSYRGDGVVAVTGRSPHEAVARRVAASVTELTTDDVAVVSVESDEPLGGAVRAAATGLADASRVHYVLDSLAADPDDAATDLLYERAHDLAMAVGTEPGLTLCTASTATVPPALVDRLVHLFDVHVAVREQGGDREARWTALTGESEGWLPLAEFDFSRPTP